MGKPGSTAAGVPSTTVSLRGASPKKKKGSGIPSTKHRGGSKKKKGK